MVYIGRYNIINTNVAKFGMYRDDCTRIYIYIIYTFFFFYKLVFCVSVFFIILFLFYNRSTYNVVNKSVTY